MDHKEVRKQVKESFAIFSPKKIISRNHLSRYDVLQVKKNIVNKLSPINIILGTVLMLANILLIIIMNVTTGGNHIEVYGMVSLIGLIIGGAGSWITCILIAVSYYVKNEKTRILLRRFGSDLLFITVLLEMILCIYTDAEKGYTTASIALSPSVIISVVIMLIQPAFWLDAIILDLFTVASIIGVASYCQNIFGMKAFAYYIGLSFTFAVVSYIVVCLLFYAETQRYCQNLQTERIHNVAVYDELTKCKNRNALKEYLSFNKNMWEGKAMNLLLIMFDIDNFKEYNDQFSHLGGDYCLKMITEAVRYEFDAPNLDFFRWGGEEFLLFFELKNSNEAIPILKRLQKAIHEAGIKAPKGAPKEVVTISIGGSLITYCDEFVFDKELSIVDHYLYKSKRNGKDIICYNDVLIINENLPNNIKETSDNIDA